MESPVSVKMKLLGNLSRDAGVILVVLYNEALYLFHQSIPLGFPLRCLKLS